MTLAKAFAKVTCRLVANQDPVKVQKQIIDAVLSRCPEGIRLSIREGGIAEAYLVVPPDRPNTPVDQLIDGGIWAIRRNY